MGGKNRLSVIIDDSAKEILLVYQRQARIRTRDEAVERLLHNVPQWQAQEAKIKALEDRIKELGGAALDRMTQ
jgi:TolA-binding protein